MTRLSWELRDCDRELFQRELDGFVPARIFDAHAHLYRKADWAQPRGALDLGPDVATATAYQELAEWIVPGRERQALFIGFTAAGNVAEINAFVATEASGADRCRALMLVTPDMDPEAVREEVRRHGFVGLKPYHLFAPRRPTWQADIEEYLPEAQVRIAHEEGLCVVLHLVKARAVADPRNREAIRRYCTRYPDMKLILAHAARGFNPHHTIEAIGALRDLPNLYCDTAAITDGGALEAVIEALGSERLLYGSDFPVSHLRGRCVVIGDSFVWLYEDTLDWQRLAPYGRLEPVLIGLEALRCLKLACRHARLSEREIEGVFCDNARRLFGV